MNILKKKEISVAKNNAEFTIEAEVREGTGRSHARRLRRAGLVPAIIYGGDKPDIPITLNDIAIRKPLANPAFYTSLLRVNIKGRRAAETVLLKDAQWHPVHEAIMHIDFHRVSADDTVTVEVPVHPIGAERCPGVVMGGRLDIVRHVLEVSCRADAIPDAIEVDCSTLELGDTIHVDDLTLPEGSEVPHEVNFTVLNLAAPKGAAEDESPAEDESVDGEDKPSSA
ncbi:MAG: 50S ribosomal protein L25/general stress protein Ctc [Mariprofundales bacterium]|nr:50S ribosomal protein L25/general stress protein Ctc [Mariprofundales bacterium]